VNKDFLFACRVCHCPLVASAIDRGATIECPNCSASQSIPKDPTFGVNPSTYLNDVDILTRGSVGSPHHRHLMLRRIRLKRNADGEVLRCDVPAILKSLPAAGEVPEDIDSLRQQATTLREDLADRDRQLEEWQTCHDSVERELRRASQLAASLQSKINTTSNELAQVRVELAKSRAEAEASRKANEALNRQLQSILKANQSKPATVLAAAKSLPKRKPGVKAPGELAA